MFIFALLGVGMPSPLPCLLWTELAVVICFLSAAQLRSLLALSVYLSVCALPCCLSVYLSSCLCAAWDLTRLKTAYSTCALLSLLPYGGLLLLLLLLLWSVELTFSLSFLVLLQFALCFNLLFLVLCTLFLLRTYQLQTVLLASTSYLWWQRSITSFGFVSVLRRSFCGKFLRLAPLRLIWK